MRLVIGCGCEWWLGLCFSAVLVGVWLWGLRFVAYLWRAVAVGCYLLCERLACGLIGGYLLLFIFMCSGVCWLRCMVGDTWFFMVGCDLCCSALVVGLWCGLFGWFCLFAVFWLLIVSWWCFGVGDFVGVVMGFLGFRIAYCCDLWVVRFRVSCGGFWCCFLVWLVFGCFVGCGILIVGALSWVLVI